MFKSSTFDRLLDKATSHILMEPDWTAILQICDLIRQDDIQPKNSLVSIKTKLASPNPHTAMYALQVLESVVKNCPTVHDELTSKAYCDILHDLVKSTQHSNVKQKMLELLQVWNLDIARKNPKHSNLKDLVGIMKAEGFTFPVMRESDAMFSADTAPKWLDGDACHRCRVQFGVVQRKNHCRACGQVFCGQCSSKNTALPKFGIEKEVRVCDHCFDQHTKPLSAKNASERESDLPAEYLKSCLAQESQDIVGITKAKGFTFRVMRESDAMFSAGTAPKWLDGDACHRCRVQFGVVQRKYHCRACGQVFCGQCSSKNTTLPKFGIEKEVRVCDHCFDQQTKPPSAKSTSERESDLPAEYLKSSLVQQSQLPPKKNEDELREEEELLLALALSQLEAEAKEKEKMKVTTNYTSTTTYKAPEPTRPVERRLTPEEKPELSHYLNRSYRENRQTNITDVPAGRSDNTSAENTTEPAASAPASSSVATTFSSPSNDFTESGTSTSSIDEELLQLFILDYQPFQIVDDKGFRRFVKALNPNYTLPTKETISKLAIPALYEKCFNKCKELMKTVKSVCLTTDCWTSINNDSFMAITAHYISEDFEMKTMLLKCSVILGSHTSKNLSTELKTTIDEWDLGNKITIVISDNATNITKAIKENLGLKHFGCFAHSIDLVVQSGLSKAGVEETISKIKHIIAHFKKSTEANIKLINHQITSGNVPKELKQQCVTRWNSTLYMIQRFVELEDAVRSTMAELNSELPILTLEEWKLMRDTIKILSPFENIINAVSAENYMPASMLIVLVAGLGKVLDGLIASKNLDCQISVEMINQLKKEISHRFENIEDSKTLACCTFLDPRFKLHAFTNGAAATKIKQYVLHLVTAKISRNVPVVENVQNASADCDPLSVWSAIDKTLSQHQPSGTPRSRAITEVQRYLDQEIIHRNLDPLRWWKDNENAYPNLSAIAKEKLCTMVTSVPCERLFSSAGLILNDRRARLKVEEVEKNLFLNVNYKHV